MGRPYVTKDSSEMGVPLEAELARRQSISSGGPRRSYPTLAAELGAERRLLAERTFTTKDSGERQDFPTGARRDVQTGKGRFDLLPYAPIKRLAQLYERGAEKYGDANWRKGIPISRCYSSLLRHAFQALAGDTEEDHLSALVFNAFCIMQYQADEREDLNDLPPKVGSGGRGLHRRSL